MYSIDAPMRVLAVCTGNICRSPVAERLLRHGLETLQSSDQVLVSSAGTSAVVGHPIQSEMVDLLTADGVKAERFAARQLTPRLIDEADLILVAARGHRRRLVQLRPPALQKSFTLKEFARLATLVSAAEAPTGIADRLRWLAKRVPMMRGRQEIQPGEDDIADPYLEGPEAYYAAYAALRLAVGDVLLRLQA